MGLDQYMLKRMKSEETEEGSVFDPDGFSGEGFSYEIGYWRKVRHIQNWMEVKWRDNGGEGQFNLVPLTMTHSLLDELEKAIETGALHEHDASGFFYGSRGFDESDREYTLNVIKECRDAIDEGWHVYYDSWW